jgi:geranylgeranyl diphosphate synthase type I
MQDVASHTNFAFIIDSAEHVNSLVKGGGKRVRGYCAAQMYTCAGGTEESTALELAIAIELFHMFAIMQDDVMDKADARRGITTMHVFTENWLKQQGRTGDLHHVGEMQAMLWGDLLLSMAQHTLATLPVPTATLQRALQLFYTMSVQTMIGQMGDIDTVTSDDVSEEELHEKTLLKTALYGFSRPMQIGAALAGAPENVLEFADAYGRALGTAFQIQDDLFDVTKTEAEMGKSVLNDVQAGEHSYLTQFMLTKAAPEYAQQFSPYFGRRLEESECLTVRSIFEQSGAIAYATDEMNTYFAEADAIIAAIPDTLIADPWSELIALVRNRAS